MQEDPILYQGPDKIVTPNRLLLVITTLSSLAMGVLVLSLWAYQRSDGFEQAHENWVRWVKVTAILVGFGASLVSVIASVNGLWHMRNRFLVINLVVSFILLLFYAMPAFTIVSVFLRKLGVLGEV